jgi:HK97 family phage portal protein
VTVLTRIVDTIKVSPERAPAPMAGGGAFFGAMAGGGGPASTLQSLQMYTAVGWLFAVVSRISTAVASLDWKAYQTHATGDRTELPRTHPASRLWMRPNPVDTRMAFNEIYQQHLELAGDAYWLLVGRGSVPEELWTLRPDRVKAIPDRSDFIGGWLYSINGQSFRLEPEHIVHLRMPSPIDDFRGVGPTTAITTDIQAEKKSARWQERFFDQSAEPGGVIEMPTHLEDSQFETFRERWNQQHRGVENAHRVALLEGGMHWVDRKLTQRDMQFDQSRRWTRDVVFGAFGIHPSIMGVSENVNRANAEAAEVHFGRWLVKPRAVRIREALNMYVAPAFGEGIEYDFQNPIPADRDAELREAEVGATSHALTLDEIRARLGEDAFDGDGGDELIAAASPPAFAVTEAITNALDRSADDRGIRPTTVDDQEDLMRRSWELRLEAEADGIVTFIAPFYAERSAVTVQKLELLDIEGYDWNWSSKHLDDVVLELRRVFELAMQSELPGMPIERVQLLASEWAQVHGAELLTDSGSLSLIPGTRERVRVLVANAIERGSSLRTLQADLRSDFVFSRARANRVARTETAFALGNGQLQSALELGQDEKQWVTQGDSLVSPLCSANGSQGWLKVFAAFQSGHDIIPGHVNCRCTVIYRTATPELIPVRMIAEARCPSGHLLGRGVTAGVTYCWRCKTNITIS